MNKSNGDGVWISAEEAQDYGLIDTISEPMKAAAMDKETFEKYNIPKPKSMQNNTTVNVTISGEEIAQAIRENALKNEETEQEDESSASATSRERATLEILKLKHTHNG